MSLSQLQAISSDCSLISHSSSLSSSYYWPSYKVKWLFRSHSYSRILHSHSNTVSRVDLTSFLSLTHAGLIIDAFGELRDKEDSLTAEMQNKCFICGLPKNEFDHVPHGFDNHTSKQHNMAHYM